MLRSIHFRRRWFSTAPTASSYERKSPIEHVLLRPGMYVGAVEISEMNAWILENDTMIKRNIHYSPALLKVIDEILVNAADNRHRNVSMTFIDVSVQLKDNELMIIIKNDGASIPIQIHPTENMYIPQLIFGNLLTGSNFDDNNGSVVGGRHGYGAKLTNIFSSSFEVSIFNSKSSQLYTQKWVKNMSIVNQPVITQSKENASDFTQIAFSPDLEKFQITAKNRDAVMQNIEALLQRRAYDIAACVGPAVRVRFNNNVIKVSSFKEYMELFVNKQQSLQYIRVGPRWEVGVMNSTSPDHMSFVNALWTSRGGSHVQLLAGLISRHLEEAVHVLIAKANNDKRSTGKFSSVNVSTAIRSRLFLFINCLVENPSFDSQGKECLTSKPSTFGSEVILNESFLKDIAKNSGIVEEVVEEMMQKEQSKFLKAMKPKANKALNIPKLEDAHEVGSLECSLILTEGDSAKALAVAGLEVIGRTTYGVLPLRGKILNVRDVTVKQLQTSEEVMNIVKAVGLDFTKTYKNGLNKQGLRYGKVLIMTDQDPDGSHIKGLVINLFERYWPDLLYNEGFLHFIATPLVRVRKSSGKKREVLSFYSLQEYDAWRKGAGEFNVNGSGVDINQYTVKYYKGLGTSTSEEAREYFSDTSKTFKSYVAGSSTGTSDVIDLVFNKDRAKDRREWLTTVYDAESYINPVQGKVSYEDFINKELIQFSSADNVRSIPNVIDGLKPAQRKVLYACFKRKLDQEMKVVQLAGYVAEHTAYHHGEVSLHSTIINMAQAFVGSNNLPLLAPIGQFGSRHNGGRDFASPRYIFTHLSPLMRLLFPIEDDAQLKYEQEDGLLVEPTHYIPIIPMLLINGAEGIGTGWSTSIPPHDIQDVINYTKYLVSGTVPTNLLTPSVNGLKGMITKDKNNYVSHGVITRTSKTMVKITELPYGKWTVDYKAQLLNMIDTGIIKTFTESHTIDSVLFNVTCPSSILDKFVDKGTLLKVFKLSSSIHMENMHAFNAAGKITKYANAEQVSAEHFTLRWDAYVRRKDALERKYAYEVALSGSKSRFIADILNGDLAVVKPTGGAVQLSELRAELNRRGFVPLEELRRQHLLEVDGGDEKQFSYLLGLPIQSLTEERAQALSAQAVEAAARLEALRARSIEMLWMDDIAALETALAREASPRQVKPKKIL